MSQNHAQSTNGISELSNSFIDWIRIRKPSKGSILPIPSVNHCEVYQENNWMLPNQKLDEHSQHDQSPGHEQKVEIEIICSIHKFSNKQALFADPHTSSPLCSSFPGSDDIRHKKTAHVSNRGPASFISKAFKLETIASISWKSDEVKTEAPCLWNGKVLQNER